jgi:hypothetical protein
VGKRAVTSGRASAHEQAGEQASAHAPPANSSEADENLISLNATTVALKGSYELAKETLNLVDLFFLAFIFEETTRVIIF